MKIFFDKSVVKLESPVLVAYTVYVVLVSFRRECKTWVIQIGQCLAAVFNVETENCEGMRDGNTSWPKNLFTSALRLMDEIFNNRYWWRQIRTRGIGRYIIVCIFPPGTRWVENKPYSALSCFNKEQNGTKLIFHSCVFLWYPQGKRNGLDSSNPCVQEILYLVPEY